MEGTDKIQTGKGKALRAFADWCDEHPDLADDLADIQVNIFGLDPKNLAWAAKQLGTCEKVATEGSSFFILRRTFGEGVTLDINFYRETVCKRVSKGVRTVTREICDPEAPKVTVTEQVEDFEWICPDSILTDREQYQETAVRA